MTAGAAPSGVKKPVDRLALVPCGGPWSGTNAVVVYVKASDWPSGKAAAANINRSRSAIGQGLATWTDQSVPHRIRFSRRTSAEGAGPTPAHFERDLTGLVVQPIPASACNLPAASRTPNAFNWLPRLNSIPVRQQHNFGLTAGVTAAGMELKCNHKSKTNCRQ